MCKHITKCDTCAKYNFKKGYHPTLSEEYVFLLERIAVDDIGPLPKSKSGFKYILVIVDLVTKYVWLRPMKSKTQNEIAEILVDIYTDWGVPGEVQSDGAKHLHNKELIKKLMIDLKITAPYNPTANGEVESQCKVVFQSLRKLIDNDRYFTERWDKLIKTVQVQMNSKYSQITRSTPFQLMLGHNFQPREYMEGQIVNEKYLEEYWTEVYSYIFPNILREVKEKVKKRNEKRDAKLTITSYQVGDIVMLEVPEVSLGNRGNKLSPLYTGPFVISKQLRNSGEGLYSNPQIVNYSLKELSTGNTKDWMKIPTNRLKLKEKVEEVLDSRRSLDKDGEIDYLVKTESGYQY